MTSFPRYLAVLLSILFLLPSGNSATAETQKHNVILVITDDQGYGDVGVHGNSMIKTPNLDKLHSVSVRLTDFHVDPT